MAKWLESRTRNPKVASSSPSTGKDCRWGEWMYSALSTLNTTTEVLLSKAPNPQLLPECHCINGCPLLRVCPHGVCVWLLLCRCNLGGLNEHKFWVWVTIRGLTSHIDMTLIWSKTFIIISKVMMHLTVNLTVILLSLCLLQVRALGFDLLGLMFERWRAHDSDVLF